MLRLIERGLKKYPSKKIKHQRLWRIFFYSYMWLLPTGQRHLSHIQESTLWFAKSVCSHMTYKRKLLKK